MPSIESGSGHRWTELTRRLSLGDSIAIVIGMMIGGGIFLVPNLVARSVPSMPMIIGVWTFAGAVSLIGALACAELGAAFPATGGQYVFLREA
jgi:APA family basic amino acid/polyamine antiporter